MGKKTLFSILCFLFILPQTAHAATPQQKISVSDVIYADLALRQYLDNVSLYYEDNTKDKATINEGKYWLPASTCKLFAAMYAYKLVSDKKLHLYDTVTIDAKNDVPNELVTDELPTLMEGEEVTIDRLLRQMIEQSDNTAFNQLLDILGRDNVTSYIQSLGLKHSKIGSKLNLDTSQEQYEYDVPGYGINVTTAEDYAKAFTLIKNNKIAGSKELYAVLRDQKINNMIPLLLPKTVVVAHKTGDLDPLFHDGGIITDKKRNYVLTIFTNAGDPNLVAHLSELAYTKDVNLVGADLTKQEISEEIHKLDPLVMQPVNPSVLGANTVDVPIPDITAADLGVTAKDLSLVINPSDLPHVFIPADSPFHFLSDAWQKITFATALGAKGRLTASIANAKLQLAEVKDLEQKNKTEEATREIQQVHQALTAAAKDISLPHDGASQNAIQSVSETRFAILKDELNHAKGDDKITVIKNIANQARETITDIQPKIPDAVNAVNPAQRPLIGEVVQQTDTAITVQTSGGQQLVIPTTNTTIKEKPGLPLSTDITPTTNEEVSPTSSTHKTNTIPVGTRVALIGSNTNNTFAPSLIITNLPSQLAAPQPVTVAKVDNKNKTMVVVENGVYTQVNVGKDTSIKGNDTNIPLNAIQPGDVVVVHGEPLTPITPTISPSPAVPTNSPKSSGQQNSTPSPSSGSKTGNAVSPTSTVNTSSGGKNTTPTVGKNSPTTAVVEPTTPKTTAPSTPQPKVIQSTAIQVVEKKQDVPTNSAPSGTTGKPAPQPPKSNPPAREQSQPAQPANNAPAPSKADDKKK